MTSQVEGTSPSTATALQQRQRKRLSSAARKRSSLPAETMLDGQPDEFLGAPIAPSKSPAASGSHGLPQTTSRLSRKQAPPDGPDPGRQRALSTGVLWVASPGPAQHTAFLEHRLDNADPSWCRSPIGRHGKAGGRLPPAVENERVQ